MTMMQSTGIRRELEAAPFGAAGASLRQAVDWRSIKWKRANRNVRHLQRRIVEAQQQGKKRKVRALQFILTRSYSARCLAVRRVAENPGRRTPGVDGQTLDTPEKKARAVENSTQKIINRSHSSASTSPRRTGRAVARSEFQRWMIAPVRRCICWPSIPSRKRSPTRIPTDFGKDGPWPMRLSNASLCLHARTRRNGF